VLSSVKTPALVEEPTSEAVVRSVGISFVLVARYFTRFKPVKRHDPEE
jgi:hypothetical protein